MKTLSIVAALSATLLSGTTSAQVIDPGLSRDLGRAVGQAAVAAERAAAEARIAAGDAIRAAREGYDQAGGRYAREPIASGEDQAIDACAQAAEQQGYERGFRAVVQDINGVNRTPRGWDVDGQIQARRGWRDRQPETWGFRCSVRDGRVVNVDLGADFARR